LGRLWKAVGEKMFIQLCRHGRHRHRPPAQPLAGRRAYVVVALGMVVLTASCSTTTTPSTASNSLSSASTSASPSLPNPFVVVNHWSGESLGLMYPDDLAIGPDGNIYVTDNHDRVTVISPQGTVLRRWGSQGMGPGQFRFTGPNGDPHGRIAIGSSGLVYVSDSGNDRVQVFTAGGRFVKQFGNDQLLSPDFLAVDGAGNTYILDDNGTTKFSPAGVLVWRIIPGVTSDPDLNHGILPGSLDSHGRLLAALPERDRVIYLDPDGHKVDAFDTGVLNGGPCRVTVDAQGNTYVTACGPNGNAADFVGADSLVFDREHKVIGDWPGAPHDSLGSSPLFGPNGEVFALERDATLVELKITLPGQ
jgi:DNA-binding beta-propeller fold protein YncE